MNPGPAIPRLAPLPSPLPRALVTAATLGALLAGYRLVAPASVATVGLAVGAHLATAALMVAVGRPLYRGGYAARRGSDPFFAARLAEGEALPIALGAVGALALGVLCRPPPPGSQFNRLVFAVFAALPLMLGTALSIWWALEHRRTFATLAPILRGGPAPSPGQPGLTRGTVRGDAGEPLRPVFGTRVTSRVTSRSSRRVTFAYDDEPLGGPAVEIDGPAGALRVEPAHGIWVSLVHGKDGHGLVEAIVAGGQVAVWGELDPGAHGRPAAPSGRTRAGTVLVAGGPGQDPVAWLRGARIAYALVPLCALAMCAAAALDGLAAQGAIAPR